MLEQVFYYSLKASHQYKFNQIFSYLAQFDWAIETAVQNNDKEIFEALLQISSDARLVELYLAVFPKNAKNHPFGESILNLPFIKNNLIPQIISVAIQAKNDDLLLDIYNHDKLRDNANQNDAFISKLISAIISKNNVHYIQVLKNILIDVKNKQLTLTKKDICTLYLYCVDYNLSDFQKEMTDDKNILIQLLTDAQCNKTLLDKIIGSEQFFEYIKIKEVQPTFQQYMESHSNSFSDEQLFKIHQLILHPNTRELLPSGFAEAIVRRTVQLSKKSPSVQSLKTFIFDMVEYSYVLDLAVLTLKSLMHYCLTHENLDALFCLDKQENFSRAFDQDIYVETFQLALKLESNKHIENLAIHPFYYNLDFQDNFKLLCYFIKKNKGLYLFNTLFEDGFFIFFTTEHYQTIAQVMLGCPQGGKTREKEIFSGFTQLLLSNYKVHTQNLSKVIDLRALIQDQELYSFYALGKLIESLSRKADLIKLIQCYPTNQIQSLIGLHFQLNQEIVEDLEKENVKILGNIESAQNQKLIHKANRLFLKVEQAFQKQFNLYGNSLDARLIAIEKEIKTKLLDCIYLQAKEQEQNKIDISRQNDIIKYIDEHKENLLAENKQVMTGFRKILITIQNPMDITHFQTAWLSYDKGFVVEEVFEGNWDNYRKFFVAPSDAFAHGGAYSAGEHTVFFTNKAASQEVRKRVCYYWLLVNDLNDPAMPITIDTEEFALAEVHKKDVLTFRIGNFFGIISSIYRTNGFGISTCYPGHLTAIMNMGLQHTLGTPVDSLEKIAHSTIPIVRNYIKGIMNESTTWDGETKALKVDELLAFKPDHAKSLIIQNIQFNNKYNTFYQTVYMNIDRLRQLVWESLPEDFIKDEDSRKVNALIENAILGFASNPFIHDSIMEDILNSPCIMKDFNVEDDNMFLINKTSIKYIYFTEFYNCVFKDILNSRSTIMPTIGQKGAINQLLAKIVTMLTTLETSCENKIQKLLGKLAEISFAMPIDEVKKLIKAKQSSVLLISDSNPEQQNEPVLFAYQASLDNTEVMKENNEVSEKPNKKPEKNNKNKSILS